MEKTFSKPKNKSAHVKGGHVYPTLNHQELENRKEYENTIAFLKKELKKAQQENRTLHTVGKKQEKALKGYFEQEDNVPQLRSKYMEEVRYLQKELRVLHETCGNKDHKISSLDKEILKLKDTCKHYKTLCETKSLLEREDLQKKLDNAEKNLEKRDAEISVSIVEIFSEGS